MIIDAAAALIEAAELGKAGKDLFVFHAPDKVRKCILVIDDLDGVVKDEYMPGYYKSEFKVIVRHTDPKSALSIAKEVASALDLYRVTVGGITIKRMRATHQPIPFPIPDSDVLEVSVNLWAAYSEL